MKKKPYPRTLPPMPKGQVFLGKGKSFKVPKGGFNGAACFDDDKEWVIDGPGALPWTGRDTSQYYCAPAESEIARLNGLAPAKKAPRKAAKKTKSIMSGFSEDVKTTPTLVLEVGKTYLTRGKDEAEVIYTKFDGIRSVIAIVRHAKGERIVTLTPGGKVSLASECGDDITSEKPNFDWSCLPPWINYIAMDKNGKWYGYGEEPSTTGIRAWVAQGCQISDDDSCTIPPQYAPTSTPYDWRQSLRVRPGYQPESK